MVDRHAGGRRPWRYRGQSGRRRAAACDPGLAAAGRAAVAPDRRASVRSLQRPDADHGGAGKLPQRYRVGAVFARRRHRRKAVRRDRTPRAPRWPRARHCPGDGGIAAGRFAAPVVRAAAGAAATWQRDGRSVCRQANPKAACGAGSAGRRCAGAFEDRLRAACDRAAAGEAGVPAADTATETTSRAFALRLRPNQDFAGALEAFCRERGIVSAKLHGGVGSTIGARFADGRIVEPFATELAVSSGVIVSGVSGALEAELDIALVDYQGGIAEGPLLRGDNPVLMTMELVLEVLGESKAVG